MRGVDLAQQVALERRALNIAVRRNELQIDFGEGMFFGVDPWAKAGDGGGQGATLLNDRDAVGHIAFDGGARGHQLARVDDAVVIPVEAEQRIDFRDGQSYGPTEDALLNADFGVGKADGVRAGGEGSGDEEKESHECSETGRIRGDG